MPSTTLMSIFEAIADAEASEAALEEYRLEAYPPAMADLEGELCLVFPEEN